MEISFRDAVTAIHGMGFGVLQLLAYSGAFAAIYATSVSASPWTPTRAELWGVSLGFAAMALLAWLAVLAGAYVVYPWHRAVPPAGTLSLDGYPQRLLMANPATSGWHDVGVEWKEHIAWFAPISLTAAASVFARYGARLRGMKGLRNSVIGLTALAFAATGVAGFFGAMLNKFAPVRTSCR